MTLSLALIFILTSIALVIWLAIFHTQFLVGTLAVGLILYVLFLTLTH